VLAAVLVYIPHLRGYFLNRLGVLELCLKTLVNTKPAETQLLVFDNGCCEAVRAVLAGMEREGRIDILVRSRMNIGTLAAIRMIARMSPRPLLAYSDDDVFFARGWLEAQLALLAAFPEAGVVSGAPTVDGALHAIESTLRVAAEAKAGMELGEAHLPEEWEVDWALSTGRDPDERRRFVRETPIPTIRRPGVLAYAGAPHFQLLGHVEAIAAGLPAEWPSSLMGGLREFDEEVDRAGYLRLSTSMLYCRHMGNAVSPSMRREAEALGYGVRPTARSPRPTVLNRFIARRRPLRSKLVTLYKRIGLVLDGEEIVQLQFVRGPVPGGSSATHPERAGKG
jgi:hypothetical protein